MLAKSDSTFVSYKNSKNINIAANYQNFATYHIQFGLYMGVYVCVEFIVNFIQRVQSSIF